MGRGEMRNRTLLERIWDGSISVLSEPGTSATARLIKDLVPIKIVCLISSRPQVGPHLLPELTELLPGVTLGDVLVEELGIEVSYGALVLIESAISQDRHEDAGHHIGYGVSHALLDIVQAYGPTVRQGALVPNRAAQGGRPVSPFRDHGLNDRFFRANPDPSTELEHRRAQRAAG